MIFFYSSMMGWHKRNEGYANHLSINLWTSLWVIFSSFRLLKVKIDIFWMTYTKWGMCYSCQSISELIMSHILLISFWNRSEPYVVEINSIKIWLQIFMGQYIRKWGIWYIFANQVIFFFFWVIFSSFCQQCKSGTHLYLEMGTTSWVPNFPLSQAI